MKAVVAGGASKVVSVGACGNGSQSKQHQMYTCPCITFLKFLVPFLCSSLQYTVVSKWRGQLGAHRTSNRNMHHIMQMELSHGLDTCRTLLCKRLVLDRRRSRCRSSNAKELYRRWHAPCVHAAQLKKHAWTVHLACARGRQSSGQRPLTAPHYTLRTALASPLRRGRHLGQCRRWSAAPLQCTEENCTSLNLWRRPWPIGLINQQDALSHLYCPLEPVQPSAHRLGPRQRNRCSPPSPRPPGSPLSVRSKIRTQVTFYPCDLTPYSQHRDGGAAWTEVWGVDACSRQTQLRARASWIRIASNCGEGAHVSRK